LTPNQKKPKTRKLANGRIAEQYVDAVAKMACQWCGRRRRRMVIGNAVGHLPTRVLCRTCHGKLGELFEENP
jgi:hypothetical protein